MTYAPSIPRTPPAQTRSGRAQRIAYGLAAHAVILLILYAAAELVSGVKFVGADPLATSLPYTQTRGLANILLHFSLISGLLAGGIYAAADLRQDGRVAAEGALLLVYRAWTLIVAAALASGILELFEGRSGLELLPVFDLATLIVLAAVLGIVLLTARGQKGLEGLALVWSAGIGAVGLGIALGLLPAGHYVDDRLLRALAIGLPIQLGFPMAAAALALWLLHRVSNITPLWAGRALHVTGGWIALGGAALILPSLSILHPEAAVLRGAAGVIMAPLAFGIVGAHFYRALADRNPSATLSAHWVALGIILWLGGAALGGLLALPAVQSYAAGTRLIDAQNALMLTGSVAFVLGMINQMGAELRAENARITGLLPFWLYAAGALGSGAMLCLVGTVQVYLERAVRMPYLEVQVLMTLLHVLWVSALLALAAGVGVYAVGFWARRPQLRDEPQAR